MPWMARVLTPIALRVAAVVLLTASIASAQAPLTGTVRDETGAALPGVLVEFRSGNAAVGQTNTNERGEYRLDGIRVRTVRAFLHARQLRDGPAPGHDRPLTHRRLTRSSISSSAPT